MLTPVRETEKNPDSTWAGRILRGQINELKNRYPDLIYALYVLDPVEIKEEYPIMTDTHHLFYNAKEVLKTDREKLKRSILHIALHGLLGHFEMDRDVPDREVLWAVMDLKVRRLIDLFMDGKERNSGAGSIRMELYYETKGNEVLKTHILEKAKKAYSDDHSTWNMVQIPGLGSGHGAGRKSWEEIRKATQELLMTGKSAQGGDLEDALADISRQPGTGGGNDRLDIAKGEKSRLDYRSLLSELKRSALQTGEEDIPDMVYYSYGLELYGDVPLVEPMEEAEKEVIDTIVIAVDTSGSCAGSLPEFLAETKSLLEDLGRSALVNKICYLECDAKIQKETALTADEAIRFLSDHHTYGGGGGTDFRPVFNRIKDYEKDGTEIAGLIYYSDGMGTFPEGKPDYPCFFVEPENGNGWCTEDNLPDWVRKVSL